MEKEAQFKSIDILLTTMLLTPVYSLLSLNVLCGSIVHPLPYARLHHQARKVRCLQPDIVCLQEFNNPLVERIYRKELEEQYRFHVHRVDTSELIRRGMVCASVLIASKMIHPVLGWMCVGTMFHPYVFNFILGTQKTGNAILMHKDLEVLDPIFASARTTATEFEYQQGDFLNWMRRRGCIDLQLQDHKLFIRNTHLNYGHLPKYEQMRECTKHAHQSPTLLVGDFNTQDVIPILVEGYTDATAHLGPTYRKDNPLTIGTRRDKRIDYVFSRGVSIVDATKLDMLSDHDALLVHFHLFPHAKRRLTIGTNTAKKHHILATAEE